MRGGGYQHAGSASMRPSCARSTPLIKVIQTESHAARVVSKVTTWRPPPRMPARWSTSANSVSSTPMTIRCHRGAGQLALEVIEDCPDIEVIVVPIGGGGLISGVGNRTQGAQAGNQDPWRAGAQFPFMRERCLAMRHRRQQAGDDCRGHRRQAGRGAAAIVRGPGRRDRAG